LDSTTFWLALGLGFGVALIIEGLFPFLSPSGWRRVFGQIQQLHDGQVRFFGLCSILAGVLLVLFLL
jgi:uncharacterized protein YjeT (DUF2065 family)